MIDLRGFSSPIPACVVLDALGVPVIVVMNRLGLTFQLWYLWRNGTRKPSQKALWGLTLLAQEAFAKLKEIDKSPMNEAAQKQFELLTQYIQSLLSLQSTMNLSLSPAAKAAAQFQIQQTSLCNCTAQSI